MFSRDNLFGSRGQGQGPPPPNRQQAPPPNSAPARRPVEQRYTDRSPSRGYGQEEKGGYGGGYGAPPASGMPMGRGMQLRPAKSPDDRYTFGNLCAVSAQDIPPSSDGTDTYLLINGTYVLSARPLPSFPRGHISLNDPQRTWMGVALTDVVEAQAYDPFSQGPQSYMGTMDVEVGFAGKKSTEVPYDQDELGKAFVNTFRNQIFAPGQQLLMDFRSIPLKMSIKTVELVDMQSLSAPSGAAQQRRDPMARGILTPESGINFSKDARSPINLKGSNKRPAANSVVRPDFKFEDLGIGGLDKEFSDIFRRAFASRIFPPGLAEKIGIQHVRGILLYGPPGTGKTLIARQIGKMLNAREPKVINGPEVLNKFVGQSEENIRKLFADAEKEQKEKGDESGLHIIIFDELDAVCKQRGAGAGGGTGVGDSVVNQLLSKLDGVDQLNNILLIGMTNRKDMIDEALLRPGRLEVHMEISLPDESGRQQILKIHTTKMRENGKMADDVNLAELAKSTRNFSGAEINGLVKSASSFALQRHIKGGTVAALKDDVADMQIHMEDFLRALDEVHPLFGVSEEDLERAVEGGIIHYSPHIDKILKNGKDFINQVRTNTTPLLSVLLHGPRGSGKTALAARIAMDSEFPFIRLVRPVDMVGMNEIQKIQYLQKIFTDAYKSPCNALVLDNIELMVDWVPVGPRFSSAVLAAIKGMMENKPPKGRPLLILATTSERTILQQLQLNFMAHIPVPNVQTQQELAHIMQESGAFSAPDVQRAVGEIEQTTGGQKINVGVAKVLLGIQTAMQDPDRTGRFAEVIGEAVADAAVE
ncbi:AAA-domain-containing protein [Hortaea werneckii]|uniref:Vesicular-fusion protein SEC18 n=1 Tax=Hortaea werneckii TaxID=91943 RepID=A0A3M7FR01_HORWE|nr:AAA-domain-containing protein [Hortaea werneckii]KAI6992658.1 AAA-domain-containing protein [Hortaea werneckii]KAI7145078.1 AAA-domain-containing protein [Hortaea werneckii]KAI7173470.1 AAA-domain-containing protein [Hortaea werneckii]KAI7189778.1 AAA-domain-containing protein [Hortaea werneckii]